jgi:hypothetical protein
MKDWAEAIIAAVFVAAFIIFSLYVIAWSWAW